MPTIESPQPTIDSSEEWFVIIVSEGQVVNKHFYVGRLSEKERRNISSLSKEMLILCSTRHLTMKWLLLRVLLNLSLGISRPHQAYTMKHKGCLLLSQILIQFLSQISHKTQYCENLWGRVHIITSGGTNRWFHCSVRMFFI
ncbi:hypothetical protein BLNAU_15989 [Blattamonas nauphoetae]|uniref:Uncharacterized protein n=1 Tax=Blattamonas nauphoetae TaxID=2049346 RepID=A0ABQ9XBJ8_9EUKA|nr:hypothetical protein BLNAU_15989 [Blattamonas nauphoetae]